MSRTEHDADVLVVGAGPAGASAAFHLAAHGIDVLVLEKSEFPREKVCGDGLTPRAVHQLIGMGVNIDAPGWQRHRGVRFVSAGPQLEVDWPKLNSFPGFSLTRTRHDFDDILIHHARATGARLHTAIRVTGPMLGADGYVIGVQAVSTADRQPRTYRAPLVIAADGVSARLPLALGIDRHPERPLGIAVRRYYRCPPRHRDNYLECWAPIRDPKTNRPLPSYGWIFGLGDGRVNVGLAVTKTRGKTMPTDCDRILQAWLQHTPPDWGLHDDTHADGPIRGAALPMGFHRSPHYTHGLMLVGDAAGLVNPMTGEGIGYAMESGELAAAIATDALAQPAQRENILRQYPQELRKRFGAVFRAGNLSAELMANPIINTLITRHGTKFPPVVHFLARLSCQLTNNPSKDLTDWIISTTLRLAPQIKVRPPLQSDRTPKTQTNQLTC